MSVSGSVDPPGPLIVSPFQARIGEASPLVELSRAGLKKLRPVVCPVDRYSPAPDRVYGANLIKGALNGPANNANAPRLSVACITDNDLFGPCRRPPALLVNWLLCGRADLQGC